MSVGFYRAMGYSIRDCLFRFIRIVDDEQTEYIVEGEDWRHAARRRRHASEISVAPVTALDARWDRFWERLAAGYFGTHRDLSLTWRYSEPSAVAAHGHGRYWRRWRDHGRRGLSD